MTLSFSEATDALTAKLGHEEIAAELGVSVATVRQARMASNAKGRRTPPPGWAEAVRRLARRRAAYLLAIARELGRQRPNQ